MYYIWRITASSRLKMNLKKKWISDLPNVNLLIELLERKTETLNPIIFYDDSESYFEKIFLMKSALDKLIKPHHLIIKKKNTKKNCTKSLRKCIRSFFYF